MKKIDTEFSTRALADVLHRLGLSPDTPLKLAFSGGLDSCVLLHGLCRLRESVPWRIGALHVDHGLQPASADWARLAAQTCARLNVPCTVLAAHVVDIGAHGPEAAARRARYACLAHHIGPGELLLTAHHVDDQAETVLLQLLRGTGLRGLAAMPEMAAFSAGRMARPLLGFTRAQLAAYAEREKLHWIEDPSNSDPRFARNYLRHRVFPLLEERWPGAARQMARAAGMTAEAAELLDVLAESDRDACRAGDGSALSVTALRRLSPGRQRNLIRYWMRAQGFQAPAALHLAHILAQVAHAPRTRQAAIRWPEAEVCRYRDELVVLRPRTETDSAMSIPWNPTVPLNIPGVGRLCVVATQGDGLSRDRIGELPLTVGLRQGGEACRLPGRAHHHKLKKLLQEAGVPPWERSRLPLVYVDGELAAIGDRWVCEPYAARTGEAAWKLQLEFTR
ncbi:MAG: tRNA lysidine(34) synthetase TilS [Sulfuricaulis sp.]